MSTRPKARDEKPHVMALLRQLQGQETPERYAILEWLCERIEKHEETLIRLQEMLLDQDIAP